jgi:hypothetical protein
VATRHDLTSSATFSATESEMPDDVDEKFYNRADAHIHLANEQMQEISRGKVSASMLYAAARFNSWVSACGFRTGSEMAEERDKAIEYFTSEYRKMLSENLDDYVANFEKYMKPLS